MYIASRQPSIFKTLVTLGITLISTTLPAHPALQQVLTFNIAPAWARAGHSQTILLQPELEKAYIADPATNTFLDTEIFVGWQHAPSPMAPFLLGQLGLALATTTNAELNGSIWEDANPQFNNYRYNYNISHSYVALKGKLLSTLAPYQLEPYLSGSVGAGFNYAHKFTITARDYEEPPPPGFTSHTTTALSYALGAGIQKFVNQQWAFGVGYEFSDWGRSHLSRSLGQTLQQGLSLSHLYTNALQFNLSYVN